MVEKWFIKRVTDGLAQLFCADFGPGLEPVRIYTEAEHEEVEKLRALYRAGAQILARAGMVGEVTRDEKVMSEFKDAFDDLDGGTYNPKIGGEDANG